MRIKVKKDRGGKFWAFLEIPKWKVTPVTVTGITYIGHGDTPCAAIRSATRALPA